MTTAKDSSKQPAIAAEANYVVGYKRPPLTTRFRPGQSGNRKGRPRGSRNIAMVFKGILDDKVTVRTHTTVRRISKIEAMFQVLINRAVGGDARAIRTIVDLCRTMGQFEAAAVKPHYVVRLPEPCRTPEEWSARYGLKSCDSVQTSVLES